MPKTRTCECCGNPKADLERREWGRTLLVCGTCRKQGRSKVLARVESRAAPASEPAAEETTGAQAPEPAKRGRKAPAEPKAPRTTIGGTIRDLHAAGKTNAEVWAIVQPQFGLDDGKKWYVSWYLWQARKKAEAEGSR